MTSPTSLSKEFLLAVMGKVEFVTQAEFCEKISKNNAQPCVITAHLIVLHACAHGDPGWKI